MAVLLAVFLWNVDLDEVDEAMRQAHPALIVGAAAIALLNYWLRTIRWQLILRPVGRTRHGSVRCPRISSPPRASRAMASWPGTPSTCTQ